MRKTREGIREYNRRYWIENKERIKAKRDKDKQTEYMRRWRERNREKYNAYQREWQAKKKAKENNVQNNDE